MATEVDKSYRATITTTPAEFTVSKDRLTTIVHRGINAAKAAVTGALYVTTDGSTPATDNADGEGLHTVLSGESYPLPSNISSFKIRSESADTLAQILCSEKSADMLSVNQD